MAERIERVGIVGLGAIGRPIALHVARRGYHVTGFDIRPEALAACSAISHAKSCADLAQQRDLILVAVDTDSQVEAVFLEKDGLLSISGKETIFVVCSTIAPQTMTTIAARASSPNAYFIDAPLAGGEDRAIAGQLTAFVGGESTLVAAARPVLETFAAVIHHLGELGAGLKGKLINNLIFWACISANDEGMKLGSRLGLDPEALRAAILGASGQNWALSTGAGYKPLPSAEKDMALIVRLGRDLGLDLQLAAAIQKTVGAIKSQSASAGQK